MRVAVVLLALALAAPVAAGRRAVVDQAHVDRLVAAAGDYVMDKAAYRQLRALPASAAPLLIPHIGSRQAHENSVVYGTLRRMGPPVVPRLEPALASPVLRTRHGAIMVVSAIRHPVVRPHLARMISDPDPSVRAQAALGCAYQLDPWGVPLLCAVIARRDEAPAVLQAAVRGLRWMAAKMPALSLPAGTTARLAELLDADRYPGYGWGLRESAMTALLEIGAASVPALLARLARTVDGSTVLALGTIVGERPRTCGAEASAMFERMLAHGDAAVRASAAEALWVWGPAGRTRALALLSGEGSPMVRRKLMQVLSTKPTPRQDGL